MELVRERVEDLAWHQTRWGIRGRAGGQVWDLIRNQVEDQVEQQVQWCIGEPTQWQAEVQAVPEEQS